MRGRGSGRARGAYMVMVPAPAKAELVPADIKFGDRRAVGDSVCPAATGGCL
jgi:hypothetical protein